MNCKLVLLLFVIYSYPQYLSAGCVPEGNPQGLYDHFSFEVVCDEASQSYLIQLILTNDENESGYSLFTNSERVLAEPNEEVSLSFSFDEPIEIKVMRDDRRMRIRTHQEWNCGIQDFFLVSEVFVCDTPPEFSDGYDEDFGAEWRITVNESSLLGEIYPATQFSSTQSVSLNEEWFASYNNGIGGGLFLDIKISLDDEEWMPLVEYDWFYCCMCHWSTPDEKLNFQFNVNSNNGSFSLAESHLHEVGVDVYAPNAIFLSGGGYSFLEVYDFVDPSKNYEFTFYESYENSQDEGYYSDECFKTYDQKEPFDYEWFLGLLCDIKPQIHLTDENTDLVCDDEGFLIEIGISSDLDSSSDQFILYDGSGELIQLLESNIFTSNILPPGQSIVVMESEVSFIHDEELSHFDTTCTLESNGITFFKSTPIAEISFESSVDDCNAFCYNLDGDWTTIIELENIADGIWHELLLTDSEGEIIKDVNINPDAWNFSETVELGMPALADLPGNGILKLYIYRNVDGQWSFDNISEIQENDCDVLSEPIYLTMSRCATDLDEPVSITECTSSSISFPEPTNGFNLKYEIQLDGEPVYQTEESAISFDSDIYESDVVYDLKYYYGIDQYPNNLPSGMPCLVKANMGTLQWQDCTTTNISTLENHVKIFPNPASERIFLDINTPHLSIEVFDSNGRSIKINKNHSAKSIDCSSWNSGVYLLSILYEDDNRESLRILVQ